MSEHEQPAQIGQLAEHYTRLKEEVKRVDERVDQVQRAYQVAALCFHDLGPQDDYLVIHSNDEGFRASAHHLHHLLGKHDLVNLLHERNRLRSELEQVRDKLRAWLNYV